MPNPFDLKDADTYRRWRDWKLLQYPASVSELVVEIADPTTLRDVEYDALLRRIRETNMAVYAIRNETDGKTAAAAMGARFGLKRLDSHLMSDSSCITALEVVEEGPQSRYIPYTNRPIRWHTDGYYNRPEDRIRGLILHCSRPAARGGENALLDHDVAYILMRDTNPDLVEAMMREDAFTVPANEDGGETLREPRPNPVFYVDAESGQMCMNYSMRKRNMNWRDDPVTREAVAFLENLLDGDSPYVFHHRMEAGQGLICNNVLHDRDGFEDDPNLPGGGRLMYRARYLDRIAGTTLPETWPFIEGDA